MQHKASGPVPRIALPYPPMRRRRKDLDPRLSIIVTAVMNQGAAYKPQALAEETGLPVDAIKRFAAQTVVNRDMVELGMIDPEDAVRMGSEALAASLRIVAMRHTSQQTKAPARHFRTVDIMNMRRADHRNGADTRIVVTARTPCPRCGSLPGPQGGCRHQRLMTPDETIRQGLHHA